jgi:transcriptional regulator with XRE-family HTH domain
MADRNWGVRHHGVSHMTQNRPQSRIPPGTGDPQPQSEEPIEVVRSRLEQAYGDDCDRWVGQQVRDLRHSRRLSLKELAVKSGLSIGLLSQIERGTSSPSLRSLQALSRALSVPARWFFNDGIVPPEPERSIIVRRGQGRMLHLTTKGIIKELVTPDLSGSLQVLLVKIRPGGSTGESYWHDGEEAGHIIQGQLELILDEERFVLGTGDSFRFDSTRPHGVRNPGNTETHVLWVTTPSFY